MAIRQISSGTKIINRGEKVGNLIIIIEGIAVNSKSEKVGENGQMICEDSLRDMSRGSLHFEDIIMKTDGVVGSIDYESFRK